MKKSMYFIPVLALFFIIGSAFVADKKADVPEFIANDYQYSVFNVELMNRFETQFYDIFDDVSSVDVHLTKSGDYYYTVYGSDASGNSIVDFFKTTELEVLTESYNYIEMNSRTLGNKKCREATTFPPPTGQFCHPQNPGWVCGIEIWPGSCLLY